MASAGVICSICLNVHTDPVNLKCGHLFCWACIDHLLNAQAESGLYTCPECAAEFQECPALQSKLQISPASQLETMIFCTYCVDSNVCAVKFCATCDAFLCDDHMTVHANSAEHVLSEPSASQEDRKSSVHRKVSDYYYTGDHGCIREAKGEHRGHQTEAPSDAPEKENLKMALQKVTIVKAEADAKIQSLQDHMKNVHEKANDVTEKVTNLLLYTRSQLEDLENRVLGEITRQREEVSHAVQGLIQQLEEKKSDLVRKRCHIEELYSMAGPVPVLEEQELCQDDFGNSVDKASKEKVGKLLSSIGDLDEVQIVLILHLGLHNIMATAKTATDGQEPTDLLLDVDTAGPLVHVSGDRKTASRSQVKLERPEIPERFQTVQVLSTIRFSSGRHYWEMETSRWSWKIGVCYPSIDRRGNETSIGFNKKSWSLMRYYNTNKYRAIHDSKNNKIPLNTPCHRFGIYLDYDVGKLSFYALCDPIRHLHTFSTTFTEPLHAAFWVWGYSMLYKDIWVRIARYEKF